MQEQDGQVELMCIELRSQNSKLEEFQCKVFNTKFVIYYVCVSQICTITISEI